MDQNGSYASPADATLQSGDGGPDAYTAPNVMPLKSLGICPPK